MEKNTVRATAGSLESGSVCWVEDDQLTRALEQWHNGAGVDFEVTEKLFYQLIRPDSGDTDWFDFSGPGIRWRGQSAKSAQNHVHNLTANGVANLDFPCRFINVIRWYAWARSFIACAELPSYLLQLLAAKSLYEARAVLRQARTSAESELTEAVAALLATPEKPALAYAAATSARNEARERERVVKACRDSLERAQEARYKDDLLSELRIRGLAAASIDYAQFLQLTTFGPGHLGEEGMYALRMDGTRIVGIAPGPAVPPQHASYTAADMLGSAEYQCSASLAFPTSVEELVVWVFAQWGVVALAIPGSDEFPVEPSRWSEGVAGIAVRQAPSMSRQPAGEEQAHAMTAKERGRKGGQLSNAKNRDVQEQIILAYQQGQVQSKNAAAASLAGQFNRAETTVRGILKRVSWREGGD